MYDQPTLAFMNTHNHANRGAGIGSYAMNLLLEGYGDDVALAMVLDKFPLAQTTPACIAWYKAKLRREGKLAPSARQQRVVTSTLEVAKQPKQLPRLVKADRFVETLVQASALMTR